VGESATLSFTFSALQAGCFDSTGARVVKSGSYQLSLGDASVSIVVPSF
jgi:hypothetical protein